MTNSESVLDKFFEHRNKPLWDRFPGHYRAVVVETNDPLSAYRIRFKCPELHDYNLRPEDCPWAVPSFDLGGAHAGRFSHPCIGDQIWITFEKQHPYGPIWTGFATPTRRKLYSYPQIFQITPISLDSAGKPEPTGRIRDFDKAYLPKDGRPMAHGWVDRYGNIDLTSSVGYYPASHAGKPAPADHDAVQGSEFSQQQSLPQINEPDKKYMARVTKYGNFLILGDQGYYWRADGSSLGEFSGNPEQDEKFESERWKSLQKLLNEGVPNSASEGGDQRRASIGTRYGHVMEARDVGWAQLGPIESKSRPGEFGKPKVLSIESTNDYRWIKLRTGAGFLFQSYDKGANPATNKFIQRSLLEKSGAGSEMENKHWAGKDARWWRLTTPWGIKLVLDDRGSDPVDPQTNDSPCGNGVLIKGRRSPGSNGVSNQGNSRGFFWEFNENDLANHTMWGSPMGQAMEINDQYQYTMLASSLGKGWLPKWRGLKENEFIRKPLMIRDPEATSHHLKLDHANEYIRLKTRGGKGPVPDGENKATSGVGVRELNQGFEARDGEGDDGPWVEMVDCQNRGLWFSKKYQLGTWRGKDGRQMCQVLDDKNRKIVIYNNEAAGTIEIFANSDVKVITNKNIALQADKDITIRAGASIRFQAGETKLTLRGKKVSANCPMIAEVFTKSTAGGESVAKLDQPPAPVKLEPSDRGKTYNAPFVECPENEVEHPIS